MVIFEIDYLHRLSTPKIFGANTLSMLAESSLNISGYPCIERVVGTEDDIDAPVHALMNFATALKYDSEFTAMILLWSPRSKINNSFGS